MDVKEARKSVLVDYLEYMGIGHCESKLKEEMGELLQALEKYDQKKTRENWKKVQEELAHVDLFLFMVKRHYGNKNIQIAKDERIDRLFKKLEKVKKEDLKKQH